MATVILSEEGIQPQGEKHIKSWSMETYMETYNNFIPATDDCLLQMAKVNSITLVSDNIYMSK